MTVETRTTIKPSDITAIDFECAGCHHRIVRNLKDWRNDPARCDNCGDTWTHGDAMQRVKQLYSLIRYFSEMSGEHQFVVSLEISKAKAEEKKL
jgi:hypothetical protein